MKLGVEAWSGSKVGNRDLVAFRYWGRETGIAGDAVRSLVFAFFRIGAEATAVEPTKRSTKRPSLVDSP